MKSKKIFIIEKCDDQGCVVIPEGVKEIIFENWDNQEIKSITIPASVCKLCNYEFQFCPTLHYINVNENNKTYSSVDGVLFNKDRTELLVYPEAKPDKEYIIPNGVKLIEKDTFGIAHKRLESIFISESVTEIHNDDFSLFPKLKSIYVDDSNKVFSSIDGVLFNKDRTELLSYPRCKDTEEYAIPEGVMSINIDAFRWCSNLYKLIIPKSVCRLEGEIYKGEFSCCMNLKSIEVDENNSNFSSVDGVLFDKDITELIAYPRNKDDKEYTIPESVETIWEYAFDSCANLTSIHFSDNISYVPWQSFEYSQNLKRVHLGRGVKSIDGSAFDGCKNLEYISIPPSIEYINFEILSDCDKLVYNRYNNALYLGDEDNKYSVLIKAVDTDITLCEIHKDTKIIYYNAFCGCSKLKNITIPSKVVEIGQCAFDNCSCLEDLIIPDSVNTIEGSLCTACNNLKFNEYDNALYLGDESNKYRFLVMVNDKKITSCNIHKDTKMICGYAFSDCTNLTELNIPDGVSIIGDFSFNNCENLKKIHLPKSITKIDFSSFGGCDDNLVFEVFEGSYAADYVLEDAEDPNIVKLLKNQI